MQVWEKKQEQAKSYWEMLPQHTVFFAPGIQISVLKTPFSSLQNLRGPEEICQVNLFLR